MMREQEIFSKEVFDDWLREEFPKINTRWEKVKQTDEPPDYLLHISTATYAIEMTSLFFTEFVKRGKRFTQPAVSAMLNKSFSALADDLKGKNLIKGTYSIQINGPIEDYPRHEAKLHDLLSDLIAQSQEQEVLPLPGHTITHAPFTLTVYKFGREETALGWGVGKEIPNNLSTAFRELATSAIAEKARKLAKITLPKILLLLDETYVCSPDEYMSINSKLSNSEAFWGVFVLTVPRGLNKFFRQKVFPLHFPAGWPGLERLRETPAIDA